jgi:two-component system LytT family response regulator
MIFDGIEAAKIITQQSNALIIFVTAYQHFALEAFRLNAVDYLLKPIDDEQFEETISRIKNTIRLQNSLKEHSKLTQVLKSFETPPSSEAPEYLKRISVDDGDDRHLLNVDEIESFTSAKNYLCVLHKGKNYLRRGSLSEIERLLEPNKFIKPSRSNLINRSMIDGKVLREGKHYLTTKNKNTYPISRRMISKMARLFRST